MMNIFFKGPRDEGGRGGGGGGRMGGGPDPDKNKKIFIGGLPNVDESVLKEAFNTYGEVSYILYHYNLCIHVRVIP